MTDILSQIKEGYKSLGYVNEWPIGPDGKVIRPNELIECKSKGHIISGSSTNYGHHHYYCNICRHQWWMDSGD